MADQEQAQRASSKAPLWLLEAAKSSPGPPSKAFPDALRETASGPTPPSDAFLDKLRDVQKRPIQTARELQQEVVSSGRDSQSSPKLVAEVSKKAPQIQPAQRPKDASMTLMTEDLGAIIDSSDDAVATESDNQVDTPSSALETQPTSPVAQDCSPDFRVENEAQSVQRPAPPTASVQRRVGMKGQITKPTKLQNRNEQDAKDVKARHKTTELTRMSSLSGLSGAAPPVIADGSRIAAGRNINTTPYSLENQGAPLPPIATRPYPYPVRSIMPAWYATVTKKNMDLLDRRRPQDITFIDALKECITRCGKETHPEKVAQLYNELRDYVHKAEIMLDMDKVKVKKTRILLQTGLLRIFEEQAAFPNDLKADAWYLYEKWMNEDFDNDILLGIVTVKGESRNGDRLDPTYKEKHPRDPKTFGDNGAVLGQWWPSQLCTLRDGVHGAAQGGIYGDKDRGAYSIVLSSGGYHDRDDGDVINYSGTEGSNFEVKAATQSMITSSNLGNHIRVLRSSQLPKSQTYRFHLERIPDQEPIRSQGVTRRPTVFEEEAYRRCKGRV